MINLQLLIYVWAVLASIYNPAPSIAELFSNLLFFMKILLLVTGGRGGSDFFQGLLDSHSKILQFPGLLYHENLFKILSLQNPYEITKEFINTFPNFFNIWECLFNFCRYFFNSSFDIIV